jgi:hemoglobin
MSACGHVRIVIGVTEELRDIESRADCERLVRAFYAQALTDPIIGFIFTDVAHLDLEEHVPTITSFWETMLLGARTYGGGAFAPHARLNAKVKLQSGHFKRWLTLWSRTVDDLFAGERAELAKEHAHRVGHAFYGRLQTSPSADGSLPIAAGGILVTRHGPREGGDA